jgi:hypothetical protein
MNTTKKVSSSDILEKMTDAKQAEVMKLLCDEEVLFDCAMWGQTYIGESAASRMLNLENLKTVAECADTHRAKEKGKQRIKDLEAYSKYPNPKSRSMGYWQKENPDYIKFFGEEYDKNVEGTFHREVGYKEKWSEEFFVSRDGRRFISTSSPRLGLKINDISMLQHGRAQWVPLDGPKEEEIRRMLYGLHDYHQRIVKIACERARDYEWVNLV